MRMILTSAFFLLLAAPATAQIAGVPTCFGSSCTPTPTERDRTVRYEGTGKTASSELKTAMTVRMSRIDLVPIDVTIPKPPYGTTGSGTCLVRFDLSATGEPENLHIDRCPEPYAELLVSSSESWRYHPVRDATGTAIPVQRAKFMLPWQSWQVTRPD